MPIETKQGGGGSSAMPSGSSRAVLPVPEVAPLHVKLQSLPRLPAANSPVAPFAPACATFRSFLRRKGLKFTPERATVLNSVLRQPALFDAETIADALRREGHRGSRATVYRTLGHLQEAGLLRQVVFGNSQGFYEVVAGGRQPPDYLIDIDTGQVIPVRSETVTAARDALCHELGYEPVRHQLHVFVRRCAAEKAGNSIEMISTGQQKSPT